MTDLSSSHFQSQAKSRGHAIVFMPLVLIWIGQFCGGVIGSQNVKVAVIGRLLLLFFPPDPFVTCLLRISHSLVCRISLDVVYIFSFVDFHICVLTLTSLRGQLKPMFLVIYLVSIVSFILHKMTVI